MTETKNILCITDITRELEFCYPNKDFTSYTEEALHEFFQKHVSSNSIEVTADELLNKADSFILIDTPDGYQPIGDFYIKKPRDIYHLTLSNGYECKSSCDHLYETEFGWKKAKDLTKNDAVLTKQGFFKVISCTQISNEEVYDWEVLHENHRYWAGNGISSHNTGKTFLTLNACREAQKMGYNIIYMDSEAAVDEDIVRNFGINPDTFRYQPVSTPQEVRHFVTNLCDTIKKAKGSEIPKIMLVLDSLGNLATNKERTDAITGSEKKDMTKQQELRSLFRVITTDLAEIKIPFIFTNHTYACALGDTPVLMSDGSFKDLEQIKVNDIVMTLEGERAVSETFKYDNTRTVKLTFEGGTVIECSPLHKFLVGEDYTAESSWVTAEELEAGNEICINDEVQVLN